MTKAHAKKSAIVAPTTLDEALTVIEKMREATEAVAKAMTESAEKKIAALDERVSELMDEVITKTGELEEAKEAAEDAIDCYAYELAVIFQQMKSGRHSDAAYNLEKILQEIDVTCKARATATAVML